MFSKSDLRLVDFEGFEGGNAGPMKEVLVSPTCFNARSLTALSGLLETLRFNLAALSAESFVPFVVLPLKLTGWFSMPEVVEEDPV